MKGVADKTKPYHHGQLREAMVAEGCKQLEQDGFSKLNLRRITDAIGVSPAAAYRHFEDKEALAEAMATYGYGVLTQTVNERVKKAKTPSDKIVLIAQGFVQFSLEHPELSRLMFSVLKAFEAKDAALRQADKAFFTFVQAAIEEVAKQGKLKQVPLPTAKAILVSLVDGLGKQVVDGRLVWLVNSKKQIDELVKTSIEGMIKGLS